MRKFILVTFEFFCKIGIGVWGFYVEIVNAQSLAYRRVKQASSVAALGTHFAKALLVILQIQVMSI